jgi:hypothetical protein
MLKIDIGCGKTCKDGFIGLDIIDFGQTHKLDVKKGLPFDNDSVDEVFSRYFLPCLTNFNHKNERIKFFNELYRIMKVGTTATIVVPAWNANGGQGHPLFQEPFYEGALYFLSKDWRTLNAPEVTQYTCNFDATWGYNLHPNLTTRNQEYQQFALSNYCNAALDLFITLKKKSNAIT